MKLLITLLAPLALAGATVDSLNSLGASCNATAARINSLCGCNFTSTTEAISASAPVTNGSACPSADSAIASMLQTIDGSMQSTISSLHHPTDSWSAIANAFNNFAGGFYTLWNALDLAECTYVLTTASQTHAVSFGTADATLQGAFNDMVGILNLTEQLVVAPKNLAQQLHFGGTQTLAETVANKSEGLTGCSIITEIVTSEGGGTSCPASA